MKHNITKILMGGLAVAALTVMVSCGDNAEYSVLKDQAFIAQTNTNANTSAKLTVGEDPITTSLNIRVSDPTSETCQFEVVSDPSALKTYNERNETSYEAYPSDLYSLSSPTIDINANKTTSDAVNLTVKPFTTELKNSGKKYAIALRVKSKDGKRSVLESGSTIVYVLDQVVRQDVPVINRTHNIHFAMKQELTLNEWTVEFNVNMSVLGEGDGVMNNQALFGVWAPTGKDGEIYTRFGDAGVDGRTLQIKTHGTEMNSKMKFEAKKWYHVAFVCSGPILYLYVNGVLDNSKSLTVKPTSLSNQIKFGNTDYLQADVMVSEIRLWSVARTQAQISNNMYVCDPSTEGLEGYWKLNEGSGDTFNDATGKGNTGKCVATPEWKKNVRIDGKEDK